MGFSGDCRYIYL
ncbi:BnaA05g35840D [Brassica napus]|uniref:BnaA05g35840D protein n=1 Tax=Brassica napus TaxID=3708 RepID=A0A078JSV5_BRANA|nr:BnaA05g35840D [Brassica napus]